MFSGVTNNSYDIKFVSELVNSIVLVKYRISYSISVVFTVPNILRSQ